MEQAIGEKGSVYLRIPKVTWAKLQSKLAALRRPTMQNQKMVKV